MASSRAPSGPMAVMIYFEDNAGRASSAFGPFDGFHVVDGMARAGNRTVASFDEKTQLWHPVGDAGWLGVAAGHPA